jgi:glycosyltransferase involved in cell wall biosynthesis
LTYPFVLSWSMLESMSCGCLVIGSRTQPVEEVIGDGENGLLVDFFSPKSIADAVDRVFDHPDRMEALRRRARETILANYDLKDCLNRQIALIHDLVAGRAIPRNSPAAAPAAAEPVMKKRPIGKSRLPANLRRR